MSAVERIFKAINRGDRDGMEVAVATLSANPDIDIFSVVPGKGISILKRLWQIEAQMATRYGNSPPRSPHFSEPLYEILSKTKKKDFLSRFRAYTNDYKATKSIKNSTPAYTAGNTILNLGAPINRSEPLYTAENAGGAGPAPAAPTGLNFTNANAFPALGAAPRSSGAVGGPSGANGGPSGPPPSPIEGLTAPQAQEEFLAISLKPTITSADIQRVFELAEVRGFWPSKVLPRVLTSGWHVLVIRERANKDSPILRPLLDYYYIRFNGVPSWLTPKGKGEINMQMALAANDYDFYLSNPSGGYPLHSEFIKALPLVAPFLRKYLEEGFGSPDEFLKRVKSYAPVELLTKFPPDNKSVFPIDIFLKEPATPELDNVLLQSLQYIVGDKPFAELCSGRVPRTCEFGLLSNNYLESVKYLVATKKVSKEFYGELAEYGHLHLMASEVVDFYSVFSKDQLLSNNLILSILKYYPERSDFLFTKGIDGLTLKAPFVDKQGKSTLILSFLSYFAERDRKDLFDLFLDHTQGDFNKRDEYNLTILFYLARYNPYYTQRVLERGADPNVVSTINSRLVTPFAFIAFTQSRAEPTRQPTLVLLMTHPSFNLEENYRITKDLFMKLPPTDPKRNRLADAVRMLEKQIQSKQPYRGYTQSQLRELNQIVEAPSDFSMCPICLSTAIRSEGCLYMTHNCSELGIPYHEELYEKYKNAEGVITWCTMCSRIGMSRKVQQQLTTGEWVWRSVHEHLQLNRANDPKSSPAPLKGSENFFDKDCVRQGGGGVLEKYMRVHRLREFAYDLQDEVGKLSAWDAKKELIEQVWEAPLASDRRAKKLKEELETLFTTVILPAATARRNAKLATVAVPGTNWYYGLTPTGPQKPYEVPSVLLSPEEDDMLNAIWSKYGKATTNFPEVNALEVADRAAAQAKEAALVEEAKKNIPRPNGANPALQPIRYKADTEANSNANKEISCVVCGGTDLPRWAFQHKEPNGTLKSHTDMPICERCLTNAITSKLKHRGDPAFGRCWTYAACNALFWPQELQGKIPDDLYEAYRIEFNKKLLEGSLKGGMRGGRRNTQIQVGGIPFLTPIPNNSVTCTSPNGVTPTTCNKCKTRRGGRRKHQRRKRTVKRR